MRRSKNSSRSSARRHRRGQPYGGSKMEAVAASGVAVKKTRCAAQCAYRAERSGKRTKCNFNWRQAEGTRAVVVKHRGESSRSPKAHHEKNICAAIIFSMMPT